MILFVLLLVKILATLFLIFIAGAQIFMAPSVLLLLAWGKDPSSATFFAFLSDFWFALFGVYFLMWLVTPWLTKANRSPVKTVGLSFAIGSNLFDIISCLLTTLSVGVKIGNLAFSLLILCLSVWSICKERGVSCPIQA